MKDFQDSYALLVALLSRAHELARFRELTDKVDIGEKDGKTWSVQIKDRAFTFDNELNAAMFALMAEMSIVIRRLVSLIEGLTDTRRIDDFVMSQGEWFFSDPQDKESLFDGISEYIESTIRSHFEAEKQSEMF